MHDAAPRGAHLSLFLRSRSPTAQRAKLTDHFQRKLDSSLSSQRHPGRQQCVSCPSISTISCSTCVVNFKPPTRSRSARSPNDVIFYTIPNADITMKFLNWGHVNLPGAEARAVLQLATTDCFTHGSQKYIPGGDHEFPSGDTLLEVTPRTESSEYRRPLTWILWLRAITGLKDWVRAYPGLNFAFEIYELLETESGVEEFSIGSGQLTDMH